MHPDATARAIITRFNVIQSAVIVQNLHKDNQYPVLWFQWVKNLFVLVIDHVLNMTVEQEPVPMGSNSTKMAAPPVNARSHAQELSVHLTAFAPWLKSSAQAKVSARNNRDVRAII